MRRYVPLLMLILAAAWVARVTAQSAATRTLDIYYVDAGQSTLFVSPSGQTLLVDTGSGGDRNPGPGVMVANIDANDQIAALVANPPAPVVGLPGRAAAPPPGTAPVGPTYPAGLGGNATHAPGSFTVTNSRNGCTKTYAARP